MQQRKRIGLVFFWAYVLRVAGDDSNVLLFHCTLTPTVLYPRLLFFHEVFLCHRPIWLIFFAYVLGAAGDGSNVFKKKNLNASRPPEHAPVGKISKRLGRSSAANAKTVHRI